MNKKWIIIIISIAVLVIAAIAAAILIRGNPFAGPPTPPEPTAPTAPATPDSAPPPPPPSIASTTAPTSAQTPKKPAKDEVLDYFKAFGDYPAHFVSHGVEPGDEMSSEFYYHATIEISKDGKITGTYFNNLDSTDDMILEYQCKWTAKIRKNELHHTTKGEYFFYVEDVKYEKKPGTTEEVDGKTVMYVYAFGLNEKADNKIELYTPDTKIESFDAEGLELDLRQFLMMMRKNGEGKTLDCYLIRGDEESCYVSISDDEAKMAEQEQSGDGHQPPQPPEQPQR